MSTQKHVRLIRALWSRPGLGQGGQIDGTGKPRHGKILVDIERWVDRLKRDVRKTEDSRLLPIAYVWGNENHKYLGELENPNDPGQQLFPAERLRLMSPEPYVQQAYRHKLSASPRAIVNCCVLRIFIKRRFHPA